MLQRRRPAFHARQREQPESEEPIAVPAELPPLKGLAEAGRLPIPGEEEKGQRSSGTWLGALVPALVVVLVVAYLLLAGLKGVMDGLADRAASNRRLAEEHFALGVEHLAAGDYELAIAELDVAQRYAPDLPGLTDRRREAEQLAQARLAPTSEARRDAAAALYRQAVREYESGSLDEAVVTLTELHSLDADYQRANVETMLATAHYQLGLSAIREDRQGVAEQHFKAVLAFEGDGSLIGDAQEQLNLMSLYGAALSHWEHDWSAAIQALKGLYALAPDYKDVRVRLHDALVFHGLQLAEQGDWCRAAQEYASAVQVFPLEATVDRRDDAEIQCRATLPTPEPVASPTPAATVPPQATPTPVAPAIALGKGKIAFPSFDTSRQRHELYILDLSTGFTRLLQESAGQPAFSPDGRQVAFRSEDPARPGVTLLDLESSITYRLTTHAEDSMPTWSPDTSQILFGSGRSDDGTWQLYVIALSQGQGEGQAWAAGQMPAWSPDGSEIAYKGCDQHGANCGLWVMAPGGLEQVRLTTDPSDSAPSWSSDGAQVAFASARTGNWELYLVDPGSGQERRLTEHPATDVAPAWSADGKRIAFLSDREGRWAIYILVLKTGQVQKGLDTGDPYPDPAGERLAWTP